MAWVVQRGKRWRGQYRDESGRIRSAGSSTSKREAMALARAKEDEIRRGVWHDPDAGKVTFEAYFKDWLRNRNYEVNTRRTYQTHYNVALGPAFGDLELRKITTPRVQRWVSSQEAAGVTPGTLRGRFKALQTILAAQKGVSAVRDGLIASNPCAGVTLPVVDRREVQIYSPPEVEALMRELEPWWQPLPILAAETGLRWGELMGLRVKDFTPAFLRVTVRRTLLEVTKADTDNGTQFMEKPRPKGRVVRTVSISPEVATLVEQLVKTRQLFPEDRLFSMPDKGGLPLRTPEWPAGRPVSKSLFRTQWRKAHERAGVTRRRFHDLRGSHISWLLAGGADVSLVMERVGHKQLSTTQLYLATLDDADQRALDALARVRARYKTEEAQ